MHFETVKLADCGVTLTTKTDVREIPSLTALVTTV